ncbi:alpha/beta fold hydrolase [Rickettsiales bacterium]|nr:alpha/beta fold hydrolase [Rickettsiales bacterium]
MSKLFTITCLLLGLFIATNSSYSKVTSSKGEYVIILHGIARSKSHMQELADYLNDQNYDVINIDYPSTDYNLEGLAKIIKKEISQNIIEDKKVNFVGYSMGGLMVRIILNQQDYKNMGRVVQLASPNKGSEVSDFLENNWLYKKIYGPSGAQLTTDQRKIKNLLNDKIDYDLGIIAGNFTIDPISSIIIDGDDDGKVSIESTKLKGMKDHIVVSASHTFFPSNEVVKQQTLNFLRDGQFQHKVEK